MAALANAALSSSSAAAAAATIPSAGATAYAAAGRYATQSSGNATGSASSRAPSSISHGSSIYGATYAPLTTPLPGMGWAALGRGGQSSQLSQYLRRLVRVSQWDIDYTLYQLIYSCRAPQRVYKLTLHRKQTKNQWARDDPSFVVFLLAVLLASAVAHGIAYGVTSPLSYFWLVQQSWISFFVWGLALSTGIWAGVNQYARSSVPLPHSVEQKVEWLYSWDVHCNSFVPVLLLAHILHYFLLPLIMAEGILAVLAGNTLYAVAGCYYLYVTFWGYAVLPFLQQDKVRLLMLPGFAILIAYVVCLIFQFNVARAVMGLSVA